MRKEYDLKKVKLKPNPYLKKPNIKKALRKIDSLPNSQFGKVEIEIMERWSLKNNYSIALVERYPHDQYMDLFNQHMMPGQSILPWEDSLSEKQKAKQKKLKLLLKDKFQLKIALFYKDQFIGWTYGWQDSVHNGDFYMGSSLVLPKHRGKGLYSAMLKKVLELTEQAGFGAIRSRHICTNNPVLIAKLKLGFTINGFEQDEIMGTLVRMIFYHNEVRKKSSVFRAGKYNDKKIAELFNI